MGELKGELAAQRALLEQVLHRQNENQGVLHEIAARTEALLESDPADESATEPEPVAIPAPLLTDALPPDRTTPELRHQDAPPKRRLGMLHGW